MRDADRPSAWRNNTLGGRLEAWVRPDDAPHRRRIGFWRMIEERMIRADLAAEGWQDRNPESWIGFEISRRMIENHKGDATLREIQAAWPKPRPAAEPWTREELERLVEHFSGANDPVALSIGGKAAAALEEAERSAGKAASSSTTRDKGRPDLAHQAPLDGGGAGRLEGGEGGRK